MRRVSESDRPPTQPMRTFVEVADEYTARTGEPMTAHYAEKIHRLALVKLRKRLAQQGIKGPENL